MIFTKANLSQIPEYSGVYIHKDISGSILYIGKAINLKRRILSYYKGHPRDTKTSLLVQEISTTEIIPVQSEFESLLLEANLINEHKPPYNIICKDDKHYIYVKITGEEFPRVLLTRKESEAKAVYFGPFPSRRIVTEMLRYLRTIFPYCTQNPSSKRPCFYTHIRLCNPCPASIRKKTGEEYRLLKKAYRHNIHRLSRILSGKSEQVRNELLKEMDAYSQKENYEQAATIRNRIEKLDYLVNQFTPAQSYIENPLLAIQTWKHEQEMLTNVLQPFFPGLKTINKIECYDISTLLGNQSVGSLVTFVDGEPVKGLYRRFRIRKVSGQNDFAMLREVVLRRLNHTEWTYPDLFVMDGGKPQLIPIIELFHVNNITIPLIGLAKQEEEIVVPEDGDFKKIRLKKDSPALQIIQRIRDEAHRFAHRYHTLLRLKAMVAVTHPAQD